VSLFLDAFARASRCRAPVHLFNSHFVLYAQLLQRVPIVRSVSTTTDKGHIWMVRIISECQTKIRNKNECTDSTEHRAHITCNTACTQSAACAHVHTTHFEHKATELIKQNVSTSSVCELVFIKCIVQPVLRASCSLPFCVLLTFFVFFDSGSLWFHCAETGQNSDIGIF
jgi:hypothetical protein